MSSPVASKEWLATSYLRMAEKCEAAAQKAVAAGQWLIADQSRRWAAQCRVTAREILEGPGWRQKRAALGLPVLAKGGTGESAPEPPGEAARTQQEELTNGAGTRPDRAPVLRRV